MAAENPSEHSRPVRRLVYLGPTARANAPPDPLQRDGTRLEPGTALDLVRVRSPWNPHRDHERVIVGSHGGRADVRVVGASIQPEHIRLYLPKEAGRPVDLRAIVPGTTRVGGREVGLHDWTPLHGGEEIELGPYRFRFESGEPAEE